jgi:hypothetical protein
MIVSQFCELVVRPALMHLDPLIPYGVAAEELVLATAVAESRLEALRQLGHGPALGVYQMEPATHDDIWDNYLAFRPELARRVSQLVAERPDRLQQLMTNLAYATAMCRVHYRQAPEPLPPAENLEAQAAYWKAHYNTEAGAGTVARFVEDVGAALV